ncbi:MAG: hypothetical protein A3C84_01665 [Candidatus Ryanbacteria bacterium RIFCSPHIGHO2_02_FULL_48_12]|uniref:PrgI family protein n=1 Tax=Candidatus Ryanbacteria bacterium RIFCSPHIGHO2_01_FULL_48_27 TaxID=1802115 RepID=A0A1G2G7H7_9BACT|nr:MAG: hypothetical protein A2756_06400 [Candidatus Ryanbacteria bacterium RIFCSPHIGHO2_01_FULL_48_27]OGZ49187.1 MAG: hypothetical protein A3C84_01665 [Candidatus Ryanbacteria bacterium RIFCSPHIGHO2_02_FULL_48_12]
MQQFQVPQFIDVEDKIFGPLTTKQFFYLLGGGGLCFLYWFAFYESYFWLFLLLLIPTLGFSLSLAFLKVNGLPFINVVANFFSYLGAPKRFLWKHVQHEARPLESLTKTNAEEMPKLSSGKLNDLSWSLDIMQNIKR